MAQHLSCLPDGENGRSTNGAAHKASQTDFDPAFEVLLVQRQRERMAWITSSVTTQTRADACTALSVHDLGAAGSTSATLPSTMHMQPERSRAKHPQRRGVLAVGVPASEAPLRAGPVTNMLLPSISSVVERLPAIEDMYGVRSVSRSHLRGPIDDRSAGYGAQGPSSCTHAEDAYEGVSWGGGDSRPRANTDEVGTASVSTQSRRLDAAARRVYFRPRIVAEMSLDDVCRMERRLHAVGAATRRTDRSPAAHRH